MILLELFLGCHLTLCPLCIGVGQSTTWHKDPRPGYCNHHLTGLWWWKDLTLAPSSRNTWLGTLGLITELTRSSMIMPWLTESTVELAVWRTACYIVLAAHLAFPAFPSLPSLVPWPQVGMKASSFCAIQKLDAAASQQLGRLFPRPRDKTLGIQRVTTTPQAGSSFAVAWCRWTGSHNRLYSLNPAQYNKA